MWTVEHPNCRCVILEYMNDAEIERMARVFVPPIPRQADSSPDWDAPVPGSVFAGILARADRHMAQAEEVLA